MLILDRLTLNIGNSGSPMMRPPVVCVAPHRLRIGRSHVGDGDVMDEGPVSGGSGCVMSPCFTSGIVG